MEKEKDLKDMKETESIDEMLRQQIELLAKHSREASDINDLVALSDAMVNICKLYYLP